jgi:NADPH-dependent 2,4-dienoyl-CoA reductase/sulfur reductase-like enzyme
MSLEEDPTTGPSPSIKSNKTPVPDAKTIIKKPVVLIVGAGFGGLMTALLCERAGIEYFLFERAAKIEPLGMSTHSEMKWPDLLVFRSSPLML